MGKQLYLVHCSWQVRGSYYIEASSEDEASNLAHAAPNLLSSSSYIGDSFEVDSLEEVARED